MKKSAAIPPSGCERGTRQLLLAVYQCGVGAAWRVETREPRGPAKAGSSYGNRIDGVLTCPPRRRVSRRRLAARCHPPHLVCEPLQPLLRVLQLLRRHLLGAPRDIPRVLEQLVQ